MKKLFNDKIAELKSAWNGFWWIDLFSVALQIVIAYHEYYYIVSYYTINMLQTNEKKNNKYFQWEKKVWNAENRTSIVHTITTKVDCLPLEHNDLK